MNPRSGSSIAYYVSAHGYGHGVRSCDVVRAVNRLCPQTVIHVITDLPAEFLYNRISAERNIVRPGSFDVGMVQKDSIRVDVPATLDLLENLYARSEDLILQEVEYLNKNEISLVVADIPSMPIEAAARCGIPGMAIGNFGWDWIYSDFIGLDVRWNRLVEMIRSAYAQTGLLLRLPFSEEMSTFPLIRDIPLVASPGRSRRRGMTDLYGCDPGKKWILLSFTTLEWDDGALRNIEQMKDYEFFTVFPLHWNRGNIHTVNREQVSFSDVVSSVDAVLSKPGFGILSDCIVNSKPLIYADRSDFAEYAVLEAAIRKYLRNIHIPAEMLYRGLLQTSLDGIWDQPDAKASLHTGGDSIAAQYIAELAGMETV